ncbi:MAG: aspartyl protease family protein [Candidatus Dormibacteraceae bacterium]
MPDSIALIIQHDEDEDEAAQVLVDGMIDGHAYRFLLDTGAARSSVGLDDYTASFPSTERSVSSGVSGIHATDDLITVPSFEVGPIMQREFTLVRTVNQDFISNLIGMDLLRALRCHFHFDESRVSVDATDEVGANYEIRDLQLDEKFHPYVDVRFGDVTGKAVWDTGASLTIVDTNFITTQPAWFLRAGESSGTDSTGANLESPMFTMTGAMIGGHFFKPHRVAGVDLSSVNATIEVPMDMVLGYNTMSQANWVFDFPRRRWAISKVL